MSSPDKPTYQCYSGPDGWRHAVTRDETSHLVTVCGLLAVGGLWAKHNADASCPVCRGLLGYPAEVADDRRSSN